MKKFDFWGNKKNIESKNGKIILSEEMEKELKEIGIIPEENKKYMIDKENNKISYEISENKDNFSRIFQYHIPREEWGKTYNLISEKFNDERIGRRKIIYIPDKDRMEIWENEKGEKRRMIMRKEKEFKDIIEEWNNLYNDEISLESLIENIR